MDTRIESLLKSLERNHHRFKETFIDEDTGDRSCVTRVTSGLHGNCISKTVMVMRNMVSSFIIKKPEFIMTWL